MLKVAGASPANFLPQLLEDNEQTADVKIILQDKTVIPAHKFFLSASPVLKSILTSLESRLDKFPHISMAEFEKEAVICLLKFLHRGFVVLKKRTVVEEQFYSLCRALRLDPPVAIVASPQDSPISNPSPVVDMATRLEDFEGGNHMPEKSRFRGSHESVECFGWNEVNMDWEVLQDLEPGALPTACEERYSAKEPVVRLKIVMEGHQEIKDMAHLEDMNSSDSIPSGHSSSTDTTLDMNCMLSIPSFSTSTETALGINSIPNSPLYTEDDSEDLNGFDSMDSVPNSPLSTDSTLPCSDILEDVLSLPCSHISQDVLSHISADALSLPGSSISSDILPKELHFAKEPVVRVKTIMEGHQDINDLEDMEDKKDILQNISYFKDSKCRGHIFLHRQSF